MAFTRATIRNLAKDSGVELPKELEDALITEHMRQQEATRSYSAPPPEQVEVQVIVEVNGDSEFLRAIDGRKADRAWKLMNELVEAVKILHP